MLTTGPRDAGTQGGRNGEKKRRDVEGTRWGEEGPFSIIACTYIGEGTARTTATRGRTARRRRQVSQGGPAPSQRRGKLVAALQAAYGSGGSGGEQTRTGWG